MSLQRAGTVVARRGPARGLPEHDVAETRRGLGYTCSPARVVPEHGVAENGSAAPPDRPRSGPNVRPYQPVQPNVVHIELALPAPQHVIPSDLEHLEPSGHADGAKPLSVRPEDRPLGAALPRARV